MDSLFPLKVNIPDKLELDNYDRFNKFKKKKEEIMICFLFSTSTKVEEIKIYSENKIYPLGEIIKNGKNLFIYYIEVVYSNIKIKIDISKNPIFIKLEETELNCKKNFLFNKNYLDINNQYIDKLNCFDINEEFEIYYRIHSEKKNMNSLKSLTNSILYKIKDCVEECNFSLFLIVFMEAPSDLINQGIDTFLSKIRKKGDLVNISKKELYKVINYYKKERIVLIIFLIYMILSQQNIEEFEEFLNANNIYIDEVIYCLDIYKNLFLHSLQLFPNYNYLINNAISLEKLKIVLKCSINLTDFINSVNENKEFIAKIINKEVKSNALILNYFFNLEIEFNQKFNEDFYFTLNNIREFEIEFNTKILFLDYEKIEFEKHDIKKHFVTYIKILIFSHIIGEKINLKLSYNSNLLLMPIEKDLFNNFEIIEILDLLFNDIPLNYKYIDVKENNEIIEIINLLIKSIKFEKIDIKLNSFISKLKWENIFYNNDYYPKIMPNLVDSLKNINDMKFIFIIIDKLNDNEKHINIEKENKKNDINEYLKKNLENFMPILLEKYLLILEDNKYNVKQEDFIRITNKLIYLKNKYQINTPFLNVLIKKINSELLTDLLKSIFENCEISSDLDFYSLITILIQNGLFGQFYKYFLKNQFFPQFEKEINSCIISNDIEEILDKNNFNYILMNNLYKNNFFKIYKESFYSRKTFEKIENIENLIINLQNISFKQLELLLCSEERFELFSLIIEDESFKNRLLKSLHENMERIKRIIDIKHSELFFILNDFQKFKFSDQEKLIYSINQFFEELDYKKFSCKEEIENIEKKANKICYILEIFKKFLKIMLSNYFFKLIKEKNIDYFLFEHILFIFDD